MTENEKAETFIGWGPNNQDNWLGYQLHAPDMTDPRNYIQALEGLNSGVTPAPTISGGEGTWAIEWYLGHTVDSGEGRKSAHLIEVEEPTFAAAIVKALAALYDAEHADNARTKG